MFWRVRNFFLYVRYLPRMIKASILWNRFEKLICTTYEIDDLNRLFKEGRPLTDTQPDLTLIWVYGSDIIDFENMKIYHAAEIESVTLFENGKVHMIFGTEYKEIEVKVTLKDSERDTVYQRIGRDSAEDLRGRLLQFRAESEDASSEPA